MRRLAWCVVFITFGITATVACAGDFWARFKTDTRRNNNWPEPFISADRVAVREPFNIMKNNGWRLQNTIGDAYFDFATQELSMAGQLKVKWVVTQTPMNRRTVFVMVAETEEQTMIRVDSVQRAIARYVTRGDLPEVLLTDRDISPASGEYHDSVDRALKSSVPVPRLPSANGQGGAGAGASGSGASGA